MQCVTVSMLSRFTTRCPMALLRILRRARAALRQAGLRKACARDFQELQVQVGNLLSKKVN